MFICENCAPEAGVSEFELMYAPQSYGPCEWCGKVASCVDSQREESEFRRRLFPRNGTEEETAVGGGND